MIGLFLLLQGGPTVGDTVWVERAVPVPERRAVRASDWQLSGDVELLGPPRVVFRHDSAVVGYPLVTWRAGAHVVEVPGPLLVAPDGSVDSLPAERITLTVQSVLPDVSPDSTLRPQPPARIVPRRSDSALPLLAFWTLAALMLVPVHLWWRRRGAPSARVSPSPAAPIPIHRWADAGEYRAALGAAMAKLRMAIAARAPAAHRALPVEACIATLAAEYPDLPHAEVAELLRALDSTRFASHPSAEAPDLLDRAAELEARFAAVAA